MGLLLSLKDMQQWSLAGARGSYILAQVPPIVAGQAGLVSKHWGFPTLFFLINILIRSSPACLRKNNWEKHIVFLSISMFNKKKFATRRIVFSVTFPSKTSDPHHHSYGFGNQDAATNLEPSHGCCSWID